MALQVPSVPYAADAVELDDAQLAGLVLTHRLTDDEVARGYLVVEPDLAVLVPRWTDPRPLSGGGEVDITDAQAVGAVFLDEERLVLRGPDNWLRECRAGELVAVRCGATLAVTSVADADLDDAADLVTIFSNAADVIGAGDQPRAVRVVVAAAVTVDPRVLNRPTRPVSELLEAAGLCVDVDVVAPPGYDLAGYAVFRRAWHRAVQRARADKSADGRPIASAIGAYFVSLLKPDVEGDILEHAAAALRDEAVTDLYLAPWSGLDRPDDANAVTCQRRFAHAVIGATPAPPAGAHMILSVCAQAEGDLAAHEAAVAAALKADPSFKPALQAKFLLVNDRGDAAAVRHVMSRLPKTVPPGGDPTVPATLYSRPGPYRAAGHAPCPCGSNLSHRQCCKATNGYSLVYRVPWLFDKIERFAGQLPQWGEYARLASLYAPMDDDGDWMRRKTAGILRQLMLFEGGVLSRFLMHRGALLPADELALAHEWLAVRHRMWRTIEHDAEDQLVKLADVATGATLWARVPMQPHEAGTAFLAVVVPGGGLHHLVGTSLTAPPQHVQGMVDVIATGDPVAVVSALAAHLGAALGREPKATRPPSNRASFG